MQKKSQIGAHGLWEAELTKGSTLAFRRGGFPDGASAASWLALVEQSIPPSTARIGSKRIVITVADVLQRWAIDSGTLPVDSGGSGVSPVRRLTSLMSDPDCLAPLAMLTPEILAAIRHRRRPASGLSEADWLSEQASLAAAISGFCEFYLTTLPDPFEKVASDGVTVLWPHAQTEFLRHAKKQDTSIHAALALALASGMPIDELLTIRWGDFENDNFAALRRSNGHLVALPAKLASDLAQRAGTPKGMVFQGIKKAALLKALVDLGTTIDRPLLNYTAIQISALASHLKAGTHLDEVRALASTTS